MGDSVTLSGRCAPGAQLNVSVTYHAKQLGFFDVNGSAASVQVTGDSNGNWATDTLHLGSPGLFASGSSVNYTATVTQSVANGQQSAAATLSFRHG